MTALHLACMLGSLKLVKFLIEKTKEHHVLDFVINAGDYLGLTPLYHVCQRGYQKKAKKDEI
jgi:ankyrin repeat protein